MKTPNTHISIDFNSISSKSLNIFSIQIFSPIKLGLTSANLIMQKKNAVEKIFWLLDEIELKSIYISGTSTHDHLPNKGLMTFR